MSGTVLRFTLNGTPREVTTEPTRRLLDVLREELGLTGTKEACGKGECGTCTVLLDGRPVNSCLTLAGECQGRSVLTIEGTPALPAGEALQRAFVEEGAVQCGFCTPGMIMAALALLQDRPQPDEAEIRRGLEGNLCRCTGYTKIIEAVQRVARELASGGSEE